MMADLGSDEQLARVADTSAIGARARRWRLGRLLEEFRVRAQPIAPGDPGADHPDPDVAPPADERHPEFDPVPPP
jgi:hypothetical protein